MIGRVSRVYCNRVYERKITLFSWKQVYSIPHVSWLKVIYQQYSTTSSYHQAFNFPFQKSMDIFRISDYDCVGFDLDNTLLRYNINNMVNLEYETLSKFLVEKKGYDPKYLRKPLSDHDLDFMQRGLMLDFDRGNIIRISPSGMILRASHGTKLLNNEEIRMAYPDQRWYVTDAFSKDPLATWNGPLSLKMRTVLDYFDMPASLVFAKAVDTLDEKNEGPLDMYQIWPDVLDGLIDMFDRDHFQTGEGYYFKILKENPATYLHKCSTQTVSWLREIKKRQKTFLITGSNVDFADFTASYTFGDDWRSLFDIVICFAKKPGFFISNKPFLKIMDYKEIGSVTCDVMKQGEIYNQGNWNDLHEFFGRSIGQNDLRFLYFGDNLVQDIYTPCAKVNCHTVAVIDEQMAEGMVHQKDVHPDENAINSKFWGSYFCLKDSTTMTHVHSIWSHIIQNYAKICIPTIDMISSKPLDEPLKSFSTSNKNLCGYHPEKPLSISTF